MSNPEAAGSPESFTARLGRIISGSMAAAAANVFVPERTDKDVIHEFGPNERFKLTLADKATAFRIRFGERGQRGAFDMVYYRLGEDESETVHEMHITSTTKRDIRKDDLGKLLGAYLNLAQCIRGHQSK